MRTWLSEILDVSPKTINDMSFQNFSPTTHRNPGLETFFDPKSRADIVWKLTDDDKCSMVPVSVSSRQVAVIIHNYYCITPLHHEDFKT